MFLQLNVVNSYNMYTINVENHHAEKGVTWYTKIREVHKLSQMYIFTKLITFEHFTSLK